MAKVKMLNDKVYAGLMKDLASLGELVRVREKEKQTVIDQFEAERNRYSKGKISEAALKDSVKKTNKEIVRIDKDLRSAVDKIVKTTNRVSDSIKRSKPKVLRAKENGVFAQKSSAKKTSSKKKPAASTKTKAKPKTASKKKKKPTAKKKSTAKKKPATKKKPTVKASKKKAAPKANK